jgi:hypothetical protein
MAAVIWTRTMTVAALTPCTSAEAVSWLGRR